MIAITTRSSMSVKAFRINKNTCNGWTYGGGRWDQGNRFGSNSHMRGQFPAWTLILAILLGLAALAVSQSTPFRPLRAGDVVRVLSDDEPSLSVERSVGRDGMVLLPILGALPAAGKLADELADLISQRLEARGGSGRGVEVRLVRSTATEIEFFGAVRRTGTVAMREGLRLGEVVKAAEPTAAADLEAIEILGADGGRLVADLEADPGGPLMRAGDTVYLPIATRQTKVTVVGAVRRPGIVRFRAGLTVRGAIEGAGGLTGHGDSKRVQVVRDDALRLVLNLEDAARDEPLERGDIVQVPPAEQAGFVTVFGAVMKPGIVQIRPGVRLRQVLQEAGGPVFWAATERVVVRRASGQRVEQRVVDLKKVEKGLAEDPVLTSGDIIEVPVNVPRPRPIRSGRHPIPPEAA